MISKDWEWKSQNTQKDLTIKREAGTKVLASSCFWIVEQDAVVECSKHCFEVADRTCEASILSLCSLFKLQRCPMLTETMFPLSATFNSLPDCWSCAEVGRRNRILTNDRFLSYSLFVLKNVTIKPVELRVSTGCFLMFVIRCENHWDNDGFTLCAFVKKWTKGIDNRTINGLDIGIFVLQGDADRVKE